MPLTFGTDKELWALVDSLKKPFGERDKVWANRRLVRYRKLDSRLTALPLNPLVKDTALMIYQTEGPNQEAHKRTKRLVANPPRFEVIIYDDDPTTQRIGQELEDGIKALYRWANTGKTAWDWKVTQFQQGDGLGIGKITYIPGHGDTLGAYDIDEVVKDDEDEEGDGDGQKGRRNKARKEYKTALDKNKGKDDAEAKAYSEITEAALQKELPPFHLSAVDPLTCYWREDDDERIEVIAEIGTKSLNPLLTAFKSYGLKLSGDGTRLVTEPGELSAIGGATAPDRSGSSNPASGWDRGEANWGSGGGTEQTVNYTEIRTRYEIAIMIEHPKIKGRLKKKDSTDRGVVLKFPNPFGPYTTGYALVPGDVTTETDPVDMYQPPILASLNAAQAQNVLTTARLSAALENAFSPKYLKQNPDMPLQPTDEDKTPEATSGRQIPALPGEIKRIESPLVEMEHIDKRLTEDIEPNIFRDVLEGGAQSEATGHRLAIQVGQADLQMVPYQNARAKALTELLKGVLYAVRSHGLTISIPTIPGGQRGSQKGGQRVAEYAKLTPEMADLNFELLITLGAETPVTKYAKYQSLRDREEAGTVGYQTVIEQSDVENPEDEITRVFEGKLLKATMEGVLPLMSQAIMDYVKAKLFPPEPAPELPPEGGQLPFEVDPATGLAAGGGPIGQDPGPHIPGVGMPVVQTVQGGPGQGAPEPFEQGGIPRGY